MVLTSGEDVETDLTTDRVCQAEMTEFLLQGSNHSCSDLVFLPISSHLSDEGSLHCRTSQSRFALVCYFVSLVRAKEVESLPGISSDWGDVDHTISELDKSTSSEISTD
jgi:hypothetical protein